MGVGQQDSVNAAEALRDFAGAFVDELARSGVRHACICPGSRSTPLALLMRRHAGIKVWVHLDERSAAFFALGIAKALREPVAVVSTSGTAAVNFAPAVAEARYGRVPLLVLTADRPPELRGVGANQTIDQVRLFGTHAKWFAETPLPEGSGAAVRYARSLSCRAVAEACADPPGPVHVNLPFREPLVPAPGPSPLAREGAAPYVAVRRADRRPNSAELVDLATQLRNARRGLIVCGPRDDPRLPAAVMLLGRDLGFPVLADPLSQLRSGPHHDSLVIDAYDAFLRDEGLSAALAPDMVLRFGATPTSKPLLRYLEQHSDALQVLIDEESLNDPALIAGEAVHADPASFCHSLLSALPAAAGDAAQAPWVHRWRELNQATRTVLSSGLTAEAGMTEPGVIAGLASLLPPGATLFAGNSMPVRDLDAFFPGGPTPVRFLANRGASGIDGVVSSALGAAAVTSEPLALVIGDLSFYHDMNGLLAAQRFGLGATIVLLNNDGGGIFSFLPQADEAEHFEELFGTPHGLDFRHAAAMYGIGYCRVDLKDEFRAAVLESLASGGVNIIEVRTDRAANARLHRDLWLAVARAVAETAATGRVS